MTRRSTPLERRLDALAVVHGEPAPPKLRTPLELILHENVAYLQSDERRDEAFGLLEAKVGLTPAKILSAPAGKLHQVAELGGMRPAERVGKLRSIAELALELDLATVLDLPLPKARRVLKKFPGIGDPGADKILLLSGTHPYLALDSNGLRVLLRLGYGEEQKNYSTTYQEAQAAASAELEERVAPRLRAHLLLRKHGRTLCKANAPECGACPLADDCAFARKLSRTPKIR